MTVETQAFAVEEERLRAETREVDLLIGSTRSEVESSRAREKEALARLEAARSRTVEDVAAAAAEHARAVDRRATMEGQLGQLETKRKLLQRIAGVIDEARRSQPVVMAAPVPAAPTLGADETRVLQAIVAAQEEERRRIARQVHDGPAQAMANVVLQSEISERSFERDKGRSRQELAALRASVNKTLQELRAFIFELRPMILDDLGLVPTLRRYVQTVNDKHATQVELASKGRDRRLPSEDEVAVFRLIQDSLAERIDKGEAKRIVLTLDWSDTSLGIALESDGRELPADGELASGVRRSERVALLKGRWEQSTRPDGTVALHVSVPVRAAPVLIS